MYNKLRSFYPVKHTNLAGTEHDCVLIRTLRQIVNRFHIVRDVTRPIARWECAWRQISKVNMATSERKSGHPTKFGPPGNYLLSSW